MEYYTKVVVDFYDRLKEQYITNMKIEYYVVTDHGKMFGTPKRRFYIFVAWSVVPLLNRHPKYNTPKIRACFIFLSHLYSHVYHLFIISSFD